jgi:hypothetical protein
MSTRTELLVFLTLWCATLQLVVSVQSKNGYTCDGGSGSTIDITDLRRQPQIFFSETHHTVVNDT